MNAGASGTIGMSLSPHSVSPLHSVQIWWSTWLMSKLRAPRITRIEREKEMVAYITGPGGP